MVTNIDPSIDNSKFIINKDKLVLLIKLPNKEILDTYTNTPIIRKVSKESLVQYQNNKYSVPTQYIDKEVELLFSMFAVMKEEY